MWHQGGIVTDPERIRIVRPHDGFRLSPKLSQIVHRGFVENPPPVECVVKPPASPPAPESG